MPGADFEDVLRIGSVAPTENRHQSRSTRRAAAAHGNAVANRHVLCTWLVACLGHVAAISYYGKE